MPFDATMQMSIIARIGLTPIPEDLAEAHKRHVENVVTNMLHAKGLQVFAKQAKWADLPQSRWVPRSGMWAWIEHNLGPIPDSVRAIAEEVQGRLTTEGVASEISLEMYYTDPILWLHYMADGEPQRVCLVIWDYEEEVCFFGVGSSLLSDPSVQRTAVIHHLATLV